MALDAAMRRTEAEFKEAFAESSGADSIAVGIATVVTTLTEPLAIFLPDETSVRTAAAGLRQWARHPNN